MCDVLMALLVQSQHFAASQKANGLLETSEFRLLALGGLNPGDIPSTLRECQRFEMTQGSWVTLQLCLDVGWKF